jgi:hypothetical protein
MLFKKYANTKHIFQIHDHPIKVLKTHVLTLNDTDNYSVYYSRGEQISGAMSLRRLNSVQWRLIFVGPQH